MIISAVQITLAELINVALFVLGSYAVKIMAF